MAVPRPGNKRMANRPNGNHMRRFKPGNQQLRRMNMGGIGAMFNTNQIPSNGYLDFTEPSSNNMANNTNGNNPKQFKNSNSNNVGANGNANNKNRNVQRRNNGQRAQGGMSNINMNGGNNRWGNNNRGRDQSMGNNNRNNGMNNNMRQGNMMQFNGPPRHGPMGPMPPMPPMGMIPPLAPPMPIHNMNGRFPPRPLMPPPMGPLGPIRRPPNFRMGPFPNRGMMARNNGSGPIRRNKIAGGMVNKNTRRGGGGGGGGTPANQKNRKKNGMKNGKRTNQNVNKYSLEKPWVNDEIKEVYKLKTDLENQLKGKKNDEIFAQFKEQRDKFVSLYDAAKQAYVTAQKEVII